jgi:hypothetical protein
MQLVQRNPLIWIPFPVRCSANAQSATREPCGIPRSYFGSFKAMTLTIVHLQLIVSSLAGILTLIVPRLLN